MLQILGLFPYLVCLYNIHPNINPVWFHSFLKANWCMGHDLWPALLKRCYRNALNTIIISKFLGALIWKDTTHWKHMHSTLTIHMKHNYAAFMLFHGWWDCNHLCHSQAALSGVAERVRERNEDLWIMISESSGSFFPSSNVILYLWFISFLLLCICVS